MTIMVRNQVLVKVWMTTRLREQVLVETMARLTEQVVLKVRMARCRREDRKVLERDWWGGISM